MNKNYIIEKTWRGYKTYNPEEIFTFEMHYDKKGQYIGQVQTNVLDDGPDFFFSAEEIDGRPCVNGIPVEPLTQKEMDSAESQSKFQYDEETGCTSD